MNSKREEASVDELNPLWFLLTAVLEGELMKKFAEASIAVLSLWFPAGRW